MSDPDRTSAEAPPTFARRVLRFVLPALVFGVVAILAWVIIESNAHPTQWGWTGFAPSSLPKDDRHDVQRAKTLWDWLQLLIVPVVLTVGGYWFNRTETQRTLEIARKNREQDAETAGRRQQEAVLEAYLGQMATLLLHENLGSTGDNKARHVARGQTLTTLGRLDKDHKRTVLQFLSDAKLITIVDLQKANLRQANLHDTNLRGADLSGADLREADLRRADLRGATLGGASLRGANLSDANLEGANLDGANLHGADLFMAKLGGANLRNANLRDANLGGAYLFSADLRGASLSDTDLRAAYLVNAQYSGEQLDRAKSCQGATLHDTSGHP